MTLFRGFPRQLHENVWSKCASSTKYRISCLKKSGASPPQWVNPAAGPGTETALPWRRELESSWCPACWQAAQVRRCAAMWTGRAERGQSAHTETRFWEEKEIHVLLTCTDLSECQTKLKLHRAVMYPSLSAMKMTLLSSNREAKTCSSLLTLRHCSRLSKSTCSSRESTGRQRVSSYTHNHVRAQVSFTAYTFTRTFPGFFRFPPSSQKGGLATLTCPRCKQTSQRLALFVNKTRCPIR